MRVVPFVIVVLATWVVFIKPRMPQKKKKKKEKKKKTSGGSRNRSLTISCWLLVLTLKTGFLWYVQVVCANQLRHRGDLVDEFLQKRSMKEIMESWYFFF